MKQTLHISFVHVNIEIKNKNLKIIKNKNKIKQQEGLQFKKTNVFVKVFFLD